jgi:hypothetical protein
MTGLWRLAGERSLINLVASMRYVLDFGEKKLSCLMLEDRKR